MNAQELLRWRLYRAKYDLFNRVFNTPDGQKVLDEIAQMGYITRSTFAPLNPNKTVLNEGSRVLALEIFKYAKKEPTRAVEESLDTHYEE